MAFRDRIEGQDVGFEGARRRDSSGQGVSNEELRDCFECPVCFEVPRSSPIFACSRGHMICGVCKPRLEICPLCRISIENATRLLFAERILEDRIPLTCKNADQGCTVELTSRELLKHETDECPYTTLRCENSENGCRQMIQRRCMQKHVEECEWKPVDCPVESCGLKIPRAKVLIHLQDCHLSIFAGGRIDPRTSFFIMSFVVSVTLNFVFFWLYSNL